MAKKDKKKTRTALDRWIEKDLTAAVAVSRAERAFEVEALLGQVTEVIAAGQSPLLVGESGVGKSVLVRELVARAAGDVSHPLHGKRVIQFSIRRCASTANRNESIGALLVELVKELAKKPNIVPFFRDFEMVWRYDLEPHFESMAYTLGRPVLCEGERSLVEQIFEYEPDLQKSFVQVDMREPGLDETRKILQGWAAGLERADLFAEAALETALQLAHRFLARGRMPRKVLDPLKKLALLHGASGGTAQINEEDVTAQFCKANGVPRLLVDQRVALDLDGLKAHLDEEVLGQEEAVAAMLNMIGRIKAGLIDPRRPFGVFLFVGPTGVGKTHIARLLAGRLFGSADRLVRLNMADYPDDRHATIVFGDPETSDVGLKRGVLTQRIMGHPLAILLLDEFEKSSSKLHDRFLQLFDEGAFINGMGETVSCRSLVIIATSNAGAELWRESSVGFGGGTIESSSATREDLDRRLNHRLGQHFRFEFINRFDQVVHFRPLTRENIRTLALRELSKIEQRAGLRLRGLQIEIDEGVLDWLTVHGYDPFFGARFLHRTIERNVTSAIADLLLRDAGEGHERIELIVQSNTIRARWAKNASAVLDPVQPNTTQRGVKLTGEALLTEAAVVAERGRTHLAELDALRTEYTTLVTEMNEPTFWESAEESRVVLERFRELDVSIRAQDRLARPFERLLDVLDEEVPAEALVGTRVREAQDALVQWSSIQEAGFSQPVWIVLRAADTKSPIDGWVTALSQMELDWCKRIELDVTVAGFCMHGDEVSGVVLEATGAGSLSRLSMEAGLHRLSRRETRDLRVRVEVFEVASAASAQKPARLAYKVSEQLGLTPTCVGKLRVAELGVTEDWYGLDGDLLPGFIEQYATHLRARVGSSSETARIYAENGVGARDPRTRASIPRYKDVMRGQLERLFQAWEQARV